MKLEKHIVKPAVITGITGGVLSLAVYFIFGFPFESLAGLLLFSFLTACLIIIIGSTWKIMREDKDYYMLALVGYPTLILFGVMILSIYLFIHCLK